MFQSDLLTIIRKENTGTEGKVEKRPPANNILDIIHQRVIIKWENKNLKINKIFAYNLY
jgi:hypothetical protein